MEATFRTLSTTKYWETSAAGQGLLVTVSMVSPQAASILLTKGQGKGYPDLVTRSFLYKVHNTRPTIPIYALVDYDPDGVNIFRCYKWGSAALEHEEDVRLPLLRWLGVKSGDFHDTSQGQTAPPSNYHAHFQEPVSPREAAHSQAGPFNRLLQLTQRDRKLAVKLLGDFADEAKHRGGAAEALGEVQKMLMMNVKAEIQALNDEGDIAGYLERKLMEGSR